jgi:UDP-3-O-[3-hydroxymyristoyl] glucosamine N-acyltransferase
MEFKANQIASLLGGTVEGNPDAVVNSLSKIEEGKPGSLSFLSNPVYNSYLYTTDASVVIVNKDFSAEQPLKKTTTLIRVEDSRIAFGKLLEMYHQQVKNKKVGIEQYVVISKTATLGKDIYVGASSYIGENVKVGNNVKLYPNVFIGDNSAIGDNTTIYAGAKIYSDTQIGNNCTIHAGVVIGSDGFGFAANDNNYKIVHLGNVIIEDNVEIGSNTTIDKATLGSTIIRKSAKLDNLIQIGHNAEIGENTIIVAQTGVAGSTKVGKNCIIGGQVGIVGHITIADGTKIAAQSGIGNSIKEENTTVQGSPAFSIGEYKRSYVLFKNFPDVNDRIKSLEKILQELKQSVEK